MSTLNERLQAIVDQITVNGIRPREIEFREFVSYLYRSKRDGIDGLLHGAVGMSGESGEVLDLVKKSWVYDKDLDYDKILEELGDTLHYMQMVLIKLAELYPYPPVMLPDLMLNNMKKLRKRYPNGFTKEAAIARADQRPSGNGYTPGTASPDPQG